METELLVQDPSHLGVESSARILVVDDDDSFRLWLIRFLSQQGFAADEASDIDAALSSVSTKRYSVLIADVTIPGNDQLQFIRRLHDIAPRLPVILVTGHPSLESAIRSLDLPVVAYLTKPFQSAELLTHVRTSLLRSEVSENVAKSRERIASWLTQLNTLDDLLKLRPSAYGSGVPIDVYITLTLHNILEPLFDLKHLTESLAQGTSVDPNNVCNLFKCPRLEQQRNLLDHSVEILERTKQSFKSKELGELRKKLEKFLHVVD